MSKKRYSLASIIGTALVGFFGPERLQASSEGPYAINCGVNAVLTVLNLQGQHVNCDAILEELNCGPQMERPVSMLALTNVFKRRGVDSAGLKDVTPISLLTLLQRSQCVIIHTKVVGAIGHFIVLVRKADDRVVLIDYPKPPVTFDTPSLVSRLHNTMTGNVIAIDNR